MPTITHVTTSEGYWLEYLIEVTFATDLEILDTSATRLRARTETGLVWDIQGDINLLNPNNSDVELMTFSRNGETLVTITPDSFGTKPSNVAFVDAWFEESWDYTGSAADELVGGGNLDDILRGFGGDDTFEPEGGADTIEGGSGSDTLSYGATELTGAAQINLFRGFAIDPNGDIDRFTLIENAIGTDLDDVIFGNGQDNVLDGGSGDDNITGRAGDDTVRGQNGDDTIAGRAGNDDLDGGAGDDIVFGGSGVDDLEGGTGDDTVIGQADADVINGGDGEDLIGGGAGDDVLSGGADDDRVFGGAGDDTINGDAGDDVLAGAIGNDVITGGSGDDLMNGGAGADTFIYTSSFSGDDTILNFEDGVDQIQIDTVNSFADVTVTATASGALIEFGSTSVLLSNVDASLIGADDFDI